MKSTCMALGGKRPFRPCSFNINTHRNRFCLATSTDLPVYTQPYQEGRPPRVTGFLRKLVVCNWSPTHMQPFCETLNHRESSVFIDYEKSVPFLKNVVVTQYLLPRYPMASGENIHGSDQEPYVMKSCKHPISNALTSFNCAPREETETTSSKTGAKIHHLPSSIWKKKNIEQNSPLDIAIHRSCEFFFREQLPAGYWWAELESNVTITAEYVMLFHFLDGIVRHIPLEQHLQGALTGFAAGRHED